MSQLSFKFDAVDRRGARTQGVLTAPNLQEAYRQVSAVGLQPVRIRQARRAQGSRRRVTSRDIAHFTQQFEVLMQARLPIVESLRAIGEQENNPRLQSAILDVAKNVDAGRNLSDALAAHRNLFGDVYVETMRAAERSGNMIEALSNLADMLYREYEMRKRVSGALTYPVAVMAWMALALAFLLIAVVPRFAKMFSDRGVDLPLPTKILLFGSDALISWWPVLLLGVAAGVIGVRWAWRKQSYRIMLDALLHKVPVLSQILRDVAIGRFAQVLGLSIRSGLGLIEALDLAGRASGRPLMVSEANRLADQVKHGGRLADVLLTCSYLPQLTRRMLTAGEEAAELPKMCAVIFGHCEREVAHLARRVTDLIEPLLIVVLAAAVLVIALAIFLPMWNMASLMG